MGLTSALDVLRDRLAWGTGGVVGGVVSPLRLCLAAGTGFWGSSLLVLDLLAGIGLVVDLLAGTGAVGGLSSSCRGVGVWSRWQQCETKVRIIFQ